ncbi:hypothetical protein NDU88_006253 [Pleurodeles waltl]|uniref:Lamina-associated polypeptide 2 alpha C-terminal domain-containing protein n=1 Tax=Pleurodeles waltl TaxID=8319 RepID=A0AAV7MBN9_PLEWA|nr:hypothetical protein NDU88_006253 [Pleurodeles waltl]
MLPPAGRWGSFVLLGYCTSAWPSCTSVFLSHADGPLGGSFVRLFAAGAPEFAGSASSASDSCFHLFDFASTVLVDVPIHPCIQELIKREWKDPDKIILPRFMAKLYLLQYMAQVLPGSVSIDSFVANLVGRTSLAEDAVIRDSVVKKVDVSLKKSYAGTHLALQAGIYGTYVAQSLLPDLKTLNNVLDGSSDCSELMSLIERQVDISFDVVQASALAEGACVSACRNLVLRDWKTDAAQRASALRLPFQGNVLFGAELEEKLHKLFKEKKHFSLFLYSLGD